eukprot:4630473-Pyramimonas_sp.AAC.1
MNASFPGTGPTRTDGRQPVGSRMNNLEGARRFGYTRICMLTSACSPITKKMAKKMVKRKGENNREKDRERNEKQHVGGR